MNGDIGLHRNDYFQSYSCLVHFFIHACQTTAQVNTDYDHHQDELLTLPISLRKHGAWLFEPCVPP